MIYLVITTYNRKHLLLKLLNSLISDLDNFCKIIIVDNASNDLTKSFIEDNFLYLDKVRWVSLSENIGGAGGFYEGIKYALAQRAEWIWMMDDDGYPEQKCLQKLFDEVGKNDLQAISPLQVNINDTSQLAFPIWINNKQVRGDITQVIDHNFLKNEANLFNGFLIHKSVIKKIGLPKKELFIRGDEVEYTKRLVKNNIKFGTLTSAKFYHPSDDSERVKIFFGMIIIRDAHSDFKNYYMFRNRAVAFIEDGNAWLLPLDFIRYSYYFLFFKKFDMCGLKLWYQATYDGIKGKLGRHPKY